MMKMSQRQSCALIGMSFTMCLLLSIALTISSDSIEVTLEPFDYKHCITSCEKGLKEDVDQVILVGYAKFKESFDKGIVGFGLSIQLNTDPKESNNFLKIVYLKHCTGIHTDIEISCTENQDLNSYDVYLNLTARAELSQTNITLQVFVGDNILAFDHTTLPLIYKLTDMERFDRISVSLEPLNQSDFMTSCETGLLANHDRLIILAKVVFRETLRKDSITVSFQMENDSIYDNFKVIALDRCDGPKKDYEIYCIKSNLGLVYTIYLNTTSSVLLSQRKMLVKVFVGELYKESNHVSLPLIQNVSEIQLNLNEKLLNNRNKKLNFDFDDDNASLRLCCESVVAPCYAIITPPSGIPIFEKKCSSYKILQAGTYTLGYRICGFDVYKDFFTLQVYDKTIREDNAREEETNSSSIAWWIVLFLWFGIIISIFTCAVCNGKEKDQTKDTINESKPDNDDTLSSVSVHTNTTEDTEPTIRSSNTVSVLPRQTLNNDKSTHVNEQSESYKLTITEHKIKGKKNKGKKPSTEIDPDKQTKKTYISQSETVTRKRSQYVSVPDIDKNTDTRNKLETNKKK